VNLDYEGIDFGFSFENEMVGLGVVGTVGNTLRILTLDRLGEEFTESLMPLKYTPRKFIMHPTSGCFVVIEREYNVACPSDRQNTQKQVEIDEDDMDMEIEDDDQPQQADKKEAEPGMPASFGYQRRKNGWCSCLRLINPVYGNTYMEIEMDQNEAVFSTAICQFGSDGYYLLVGTAVNVVLNPKSCSSAFIRVYKFNQEGTALEHVHTVCLG
jgi:splicing factor 3B subunit 3